MRTTVRQVAVGWIVPLAVVTAVAGWWVADHPGAAAEDVPRPGGEPVVQVDAGFVLPGANTVGCACADGGTVSP